MSNFNFKDNLTIDNGKFVKWFDTTGISRNNIIGLDSIGNLNINSSLTNGDIFLNSNNSGSNTFINKNNPSGITLVGNQLAINISNTSNINSNITLPINSWIGINTTINSNNGYLGLSPGAALNNSYGSNMILYGNNSTTNSLAGQLQLIAGNVTTGHLQFYTGNKNLVAQILNSGTTNFLPDGTTIVLSISTQSTTLTNQIIFTNTTNSISPTTGSLQIAGGIGISGNTFINGTLSINGNITSSNIYTNQATIANLIISNATASNILTTSITSNTYSGTSATIPNIVSTNISSSSINLTGLTTSNALFTGLISANNLASTTATISNVINTNISSSALNLSIGLTTGSLLASGFSSLQGTTITNLNVTTSTIPNMINTNMSSATLNLSIGLTTSNALFTGLISTNNLASTKATIPNIINTNISSSTINLSGITSTFAGTFTAGNGITSSSVCSGLLFPSATLRSFRSILSMSALVSTGGNYFTQYTIDGIQTDLSWLITETVIGNTPLLSFTMDTTGQLYYTSSSIPSFTSNTIRYDATAYSI